MKIIIDVMGGDNAPEAGVIGVLDAAAAMPEHSYIIVGRENEIRDTARAAGRETELDGIRIVHADGVITMEDQNKRCKALCDSLGAAVRASDAAYRLRREYRRSARVPASVRGHGLDIYEECVRHRVAAGRTA